MQELQMLCQSRGISLDFDCHRSHDGRYQGSVFIGPMTFVGSMARTSDQAVESAAGVGLFNLVNCIIYADVIT